MKKSKILVIALIVVLAALGVGAVLIFSENTGMTYAHADRYTTGAADVTGKVESLDVNWKSGGVQIEYHPGEGIHISETGNMDISGDDELRWWLDGTTLRIQYAKSGRFRIFDRLQKTLTVSLPEGTALKAAKIHLTSGNINAQELTADEAEVKVTSGNVNLAAAAGTFRAEATSGSLNIRLTGVTKDVSVNVTSGNITLDAEDARRLSVKSTSGDIRISGRTGDADVSATSGKINVRFSTFNSLNIDVTSGTVTAALPENPGFRCKVEQTSGRFDYTGIAFSKDGGTYSCGNGEKSCSIKTTSGNITIEKAD